MKKIICAAIALVTLSFTLVSCNENVPKYSSMAGSSWDAECRFSNQIYTELIGDLHFYSDSTGYMNYTKLYGDDHGRHREFFGYRFYNDKIQFTYGYYLEGTYQIEERTKNKLVLNKYGYLSKGIIILKRIE